MEACDINLHSFFAEMTGEVVIQSFFGDEPELK